MQSINGAWPHLYERASQSPLSRKMPRWHRLPASCTQMQWRRLKSRSTQLTAPQLASSCARSGNRWVLGML